MKVVSTTDVEIVANTIDNIREDVIKNLLTCYNMAMIEFKNSLTFLIVNSISTAIVAIIMSYYYLLGCVIIFSSLLLFITSSSIFSFVSVS